jgi:hypothetical protein
MAYAMAVLTILQSATMMEVIAATPIADQQSTGVVSQAISVKATVLG